MPTPNFKLLLHALRLGQPQDPHAAAVALAEALAAQEEVIEDLRRKLQVALSALQILEAKTSRLDAILADPHRRARPDTEPERSAPQSQGPQSHRPQSHRPPAPATPPVDIAADDSEDDEFRVETVVVHKRDVELLKNREAPFQIAPPGQHPAERGSIPGAPWARGQAAQVRPPIAEDFTLDAHDERHLHHDPLDEGDGEDDDGETYRDAGGKNALATALGLSPHDPRLRTARTDVSRAGEPPKRPPPKRPT